MAFVRSHDIDIYYESHGEGPAILFSHGGGGNAASWFAQVAHFRGSHRCIVFDHRGFGRSRYQAERFEPDLYAEDVRAILDDLSVDRVHIVAQSLGALTAVRLALQSPERVQSLVLSNSPLGIDDEFAVQSVMQGAIRIAQLGVEGMRELFSPQSLENPRSLELYSTLGSFNVDVRPDLAPTILAKEILLPTERLKEIRCPVVTVTGRYDKLVPPEVMQRFASLIPGARCVEFEASGHSPYYEEPEAFNAFVADWIREASRNQP